MGVLVPNGYTPELWEGWRDAPTYYPSKQRGLKDGSYFVVYLTKFFIHATRYRQGELLADARFTDESKAAQFANDCAELNGGWAK